MNIIIRKFSDTDLSQMIEIWNEIVEEGIAFPQEDLLTIDSGREFFGSQTYTGVAEDSETGKILGLYILHPNNIGRCGHICNASYAVSSVVRGLHIGEKLVLHSLAKGKELGFRLMQFNAVVKTNLPALHLYEKNGFVKIGEIPGGFYKKNGEYEDIVLFYHTLDI